jgi:hypothetical protein
MLPPYVYDLIAAVQRYEDEHGDKSMCFDGILNAVPADEQHAARVLGAYKLEHERPSPMQATIAPGRATIGGEGYRFAQPVPSGATEVPPSRPRLRCALTPVMPEARQPDPTAATDVQEPLNRAVRRAVDFNERYGLGRPEEFQLNPADAERFDVTDADNLIVDGVTYEFTLNPHAEPGWLRIFTDDRWRGADLPPTPRKA